MYIYERNKVGHRYFQRPLSSQGGSVFRQVRRGDAVQTAFTSGRAGRRRRGGRHPSPCRWAERLPAGQEMVLLCGSGDRIPLLGAGVSQRDTQPCSSHEAGSVPPRVPCSPALAWGRVFPERETGDGKGVLEQMDLHQILCCLRMSNAVCIFDVISSAIKLTPKLACGAGNTRRDREEGPVCFLTGSRVSFVGLIRCVALIRTGVIKAYSHWFMASGGQCLLGWAAD